MISPTIQAMPIDSAAWMQELRFAGVQLSTGVRMHYAEYGDSHGEPIVFLHGFTDSWFSFSPVLEHLSAKYHVYMLDQRGHGNSSEPSSGYSVADFADDALAFMDAMHLQQVTLIGHSMGSFVAQRVAQRVSNRVTRLVLIGSATNPYTDNVDEFLKAVNTLEDPVPAEFARDFQVSTLYAAVPDGFLDAVVAESTKLSAHVWRSALGELLVSGATLALDQIKAPTLILWGDRDSIWSRSEQDALAARIPDAELRVYEETGHALHWERPAQFARDLERFIERTSQA